MINNVILVGRLTKDIEIRQTTSGSKTTSFALAVNRTSKKEGQPDADFINCVAWNKTAELMAQYLRKGSLIGIEGRIQTRSYDNQQGQKVYVTEVLVGSVTFLEPKGSAGAQNGYGQANAYQSQNRGYTGSKQGNNGFHSAFDELDIASDDLPF